ncbi:AMP-binding protein [Nocardia vaccinii]|uniref:AMP-binding protein n=1 Tax=Nocardia vaccinii TaxID=1822 RepID=UPI000A0291E2|nr:AMP-binding protein [Nocardia vaccinii]
MSLDVSARVQAILNPFAPDDADVTWLLCDRHPAERTALTIVSADLSRRSYSYAELSSSSAQVAGYLRDRGVTRGDRVATVMGKSSDLVSVILGIWRVGAVYVPLFTAFAEKAIEARLTESRTVLVLVDRDQRHKVPNGWEVGVLDDQPDGITRAITAAEAFEGSTPVGANAPLVHMFTSGTTGTPKGVVHPVRYLAGWIGYLEFGLGVNPAATFWCGADPGWAYGLYTAIAAPLAAGIPTVLLEGGFTPATTWAVLDQLRVTDFTAAPTVYRGLLAAAETPPTGLALQRLSSAGEPLTPEVNDWADTTLGLRVHDHFGQTELGMPIGFAHHPALARDVVAGAMGSALPGWEVTILHLDSEDIAEPGTTGRLAVVVPDSPFMTFTGYAESADAQSRFCGDGRFFTTGDSASIDAEGLIRFSARDDDVIIMAGYRIGPFDVESALLRHPEVVECAVVAEPDTVRGEVVVAHVVLSADTTATDALATELQNWVKTNYAAHAYPRRIHFVESLPKTPSGKVQRAELRRRAAEARA